jgi:hypothetical protein
MLALIRIGDSEVELVVDYEPGLVAAIKSLPKPARRFNRETKTWRISLEALDWLLETLQKRGIEVRYQGDRWAVIVPGPWRTLGVLPGVPREVVEAAYRAWVKLLHPDHNGNGQKDATERLIEVNQAIEVIRQYYR